MTGLLNQPMEQKKAVPLSELGEFGLIRKLTQDIILRHPSTRKGIGDDAAVVDHTDFRTVVTTDLLLEGIHFDLTYVPLKHLGYKAVVVNLSDVYAMNAVPLQITVSLGISAKMSLKAVEDLYSGIKLACNQYEVDIIGGDTSASLTGLTISITALGTAPAGHIVYRNGARRGDLICVTGNLGAAYMGLMLLQRENKLYREDPQFKPRLDAYPYLLERQLKPDAQKDVIRMFRAKGIRPTSMIDISDGLSSDLLHICEESGMGCRLYSDRIPIHEETAKLAADMLMSPAVAALVGGEDYELLFTISPDDYPKIEGIPGITAIGNMLGEKDGQWLVLPDQTELPLESQGWNAFKEEQGFHRTDP